jgi:stearoyl-CoA desaturase (delta-9 desaturase)
VTLQEDVSIYTRSSTVRRINRFLNFSEIRIPFEKVNWTISSFLIGTLFLSLTAVPVYLCFFGLDWFQVALFLVMFCACGFSITLGYHRLYSHLSFQAHWLVRLLTLVFGAGAFENSVFFWACEHRSHHKNVDHEEDPYWFPKDSSTLTSAG